MFLYLLCLALSLSLSLSAEEIGNNKYKNLVRLEEILKDDPYGQVPPFVSISSERVAAFLDDNSYFDAEYYELINKIEHELSHTELDSEPRESVEWESSVKSVKAVYDRMWHANKMAIKRAQAESRHSRGAPIGLVNGSSNLSELARAVFSSGYFPFNSREMNFLWRMQHQRNGVVLTVRSSGLEDSATTANAGLYLTVPYVHVEEQAIVRAMGEVVASYLALPAVKNNLKAGLKLADMVPCVPVILQCAVGEPLSGVTEIGDIPVSGVAFTTQSSLSSETFSVAEINAAYGHGEGIVANRVLVDRYYVVEAKERGESLFVCPVISVKRQRLIPTDKGLQPVKNPDQIINKPCLDQERIERLHAVLKKIERAYGQSMDVEFVITGGVIYIVQARPAMRCTQEPSYIPDTLLSDEQQNKKIALQRIVAGSSQVCVITDPQRVLIKDTLDEADADDRRNTAQAVFVASWASPLSHAAVNFIGFGTPCFYVQDFKAVHTVLATVSPDYPLVIDTQRQTMYQWNVQQQAIQSVIQSGWYEHPIERTFSLVNGQISYDVVKNSSIVPLDAVLMKQLNSLRDALGGFDQRLLLDKVVACINHRLLLTERFMRYQKYLIKPELVFNLSAFKNELSAIVGRLSAAMVRNADRFELLFYHKMLEALVYQEDGDGIGINCYTYRWFLDDMLSWQWIVRLQKNGFAGRDDLLKYTDYCPAGELAEGWRTFVDRVGCLSVQKISSPKEVEIFQRFLARLEKADGLSVWFATVFYQEMRTMKAGHYSDVLVHDTLQRLSIDEDAPGLKEAFVLAESLRDTAAVVKMTMQKCTTRKALESLWGDIKQSLIEPLTHKDFANKFWGLPAVGRLLICQELRTVVDVVDETIKHTKSLQSLTFEERKLLFAMMVNDFRYLCKKLLKKIMARSMLAYRGEWSRGNYLRKVDSLSKQIVEQYAGESEADYFKKSPEFSVQAAMIGSNTEFSRHFPKTPEDLFMLVHQNSLVAVSAIQGCVFGTGKSLAETLYMPSLLRTVFDCVEKSRIRKSVIGFSYDNSGVVIYYNMPLNNHSATFQLDYKFTTQETKVHVQYLGPARNRWEQIAFMAAASPELSPSLTLTGPILFDYAAGCVTWSWNVADEEQIKTIMKYVKFMNWLSFDNHIANRSVKSCSFNKVGDRTRVVLNGVLSSCEQRIKGKLRQDWNDIITSIS